MKMNKELTRAQVLVFLEEYSHILSNQAEHEAHPERKAGLHEKAKAVLESANEIDQLLR